MPWELNIRSHSGELEDCQPLGSSRKVQNALKKVFPDLGWDSKSQGTCDFEEGTVEFRLQGDPVEMISLRVHNADPSLPLILLARDQKWYVENESTGESLDDEESPSEDDLNQLRAQLDVERKKSLAEDRKKASKSRLPKVKEEGSVVDYLQGDHGFLRLVSLFPTETADDAWIEYAKYINAGKLFMHTNRHPMMIGGNTEIQIQTGERFGLFHYGDDAPDSSFVLLSGFCEASSREEGLIADGKVCVATREPVPAAACRYITRAAGPNRKRELE